MVQSRVLSGVQPTGALHLGNWLGAALEPEAGARNFTFGGPKLPQLKVHRFRVDLTED